jgi:D-alanine--poly(phosphoribitol) ligase subunit 2
LQIILETIINKMIKMIKLKKTNKKIVEDILIEIKPNLKSKIKNRKLKLLDNGLIDSFDIIQLILKIEKITKKKIKIGKFDRNIFSTVNQITKLL